MIFQNFKNFSTTKEEIQTVASARQSLCKKWGRVQNQSLFVSLAMSLVFALFCCEYCLLDHVKVSLSHKRFKEAEEEAMEDKEIMNCLTIFMMLTLHPLIQERVEQSGSDLSLITLHSSHWQSYLQLETFEAVQAQANESCCYLYCYSLNHYLVSDTNRSLCFTFSFSHYLNSTVSRFVSSSSS